MRQPPALEGQLKTLYYTRTVNLDHAAQTTDIQKQLLVLVLKISGGTKQTKSSIFCLEKASSEKRTQLD